MSMRQLRELHVKNMFDPRLHFAKVASIARVRSNVHPEGPSLSLRRTRQTTCRNGRETQRAVMWTGLLPNSHGATVYFSQDLALADAQRIERSNRSAISRAHNGSANLVAKTLGDLQW